MTDRYGTSRPAQPSTAEERNTDWALREMESALRGLRYGEVTVIVQDGVVVQVQRTERKRYRSAR